MFKKGKTNTIITIILLIATYFLNLVDYVQTAYGIQNFGIGIELNPLIRFCFEHDIALQVKLIVPLILMLITGFITIKIEPHFIYVAWCEMVMIALVVLHNFCQLDKMGLLRQSDDELKMIISITYTILTYVFAAVCGGLLAYIKHLKITIKELKK